MLSAERMADIRDQLAARGLHTVVVFLMRDPVERIWSHIRMKAHRRPGQFDVPLQEVLARDHAEHSYAGRTRYEETLATLDQVFAADDVHVGLYETLFADPKQARTIARLVGIDPPRPKLGQKRNASPRPDAGLPEEVARPVAEHFAETYREVARRRPDLDVALALAPRQVRPLTRGGRGGRASDAVGVEEVALATLWGSRRSRLPRCGGQEVALHGSRRSR